VGEIFVAVLDRDPCPDPAETLTLLAAELHRRTDNPESDMTRLALQEMGGGLAGSRSAPPCPSAICRRF
jgi:hypothetical protein